MNILLKTIGILLSALVAAAVLGYFWLQDTERVKQELQSWVNQNSDYEVQLKGDVQWQVLPKIYLQLADVSVADGQQRVQIDLAEVSVNPQALWNPVDQWQVDELRFTKVSITEPASAQDAAMAMDSEMDSVMTKIDLPVLHMQGLRYNQQIPTYIEFSLAESTAPSDQVSGNLSADITVTRATPSTGQRITMDNLLVQSTLGNAACSAQAEETLNPQEAVPEQSDDLLPLQLMMDYAFTLDCDLSELEAEGISIAKASLAVTNATSVTDLSLDIPQIFTGSATLTATVDYTDNPLWRIETTATDVLIEQVTARQDEPVNWQGPISLDGQFEMNGNTEAALQQSVNGTVEFSSANGQIDVRRVKAQLQQLALLTNRSNDVARWPEQWPYALMQGRWRVQGPHQQVNVAIDNMSINGEGSYDFNADYVDLLSHVTIHPAAGASEFTINPLLLDTPIPIRCRGASSDPNCRLDEKAGQNLLAQSLRKDSDTGVRRKLEEKIEENVPEQYREVARDLLDLLGRALESN